MFAQKEGFFKGKVKANTWEGLKSKLDKIDFSKVDSSYNESFDGLEIDMVITVKGKKKHISGQMGDMLTNLKLVIRDFMKNSRIA